MNINLVTPWNIIEIQSVEFSIEPNEHSSLNFIIVVDSNLDLAERDFNNEDIELFVDGSSIFAGSISFINLQYSADFSVIECMCYSGSKKLDLEKKNKSYQNVNLLYEELINEVVNETKNSGFICTVGENSKIGYPIIQYQETDWNFIKRLASHFNSPIYPETEYSLPRFWFGIPNGSKGKIKEYNIIKVWTDFKLYKKISNINSNIKISDCLFYRISSKNSANIGDKVNVNNGDFLIYKKYGKLLNGEFIYEYVLCSNIATLVTNKYNSIIRGMSIIGEVLETSGERLKVKFNIDKEQNKETAYLYPFTPATGNTMYCMPKVGTNVSVYFPSEKEQDAKVVNCVRNNAKSFEGFSDSNNRVFTSEHEKQMNLLKDQVNFSAGENKSIKLIVKSSDEGMDNAEIGVTIDCSEGINITAIKNIKMNALGKIQVLSQKNLLLSSLKLIDISENKEGQILIDTEVNMLGKNIRFYGLTEKLESIDDAPKRKEFSVGKLLVGIGIGLLAAAAVAAVAALAVVAAPLVIGAAVTAATVSTAVTVGTAVFAGGAIAVAFQASYDIHHQTNSDCQKYAAVGFGAATGTAIALIPGVAEMGLVGTLLLGGVGNVVSYGLINLLDGDDSSNINGETALAEFGFGVFFAGIGRIVGKIKGSRGVNDPKNVANNYADDILAASDDRALNSAKNIRFSGAKIASQISKFLNGGEDEILDSLFSNYGILNRSTTALKAAIRENPQIYSRIIEDQIRNSVKNATNQSIRKMLSDPEFWKAVTMNLGIDSLPTSAYNSMSQSYANQGENTDDDSVLDSIADFIFGENNIRSDFSY